jgi:hypothetical protein
MIALLTPFLPILAQFAFWVLEYFVSQHNNDQESQVLFINMAEQLRKIGITNVKSRYEAESQLDENDKAWNEKENKK